MPDQKISELAAATLPLAGTEQVPVVQGGATKRAQVSAVRDVDLRSEVETARGSRSNLNARISTISNFASPNAVNFVVGNYYDGAFHATNPASLTGVANRLDLGPFYNSEALRIDEIGVAVVTAVAGALARCCIYSAGSDNLPLTKLYEGPSDLDLSTTGFKAHSIDFTFENGRIYWLGVLQSSTASLRTIPITSAVNFGGGGGGGGNFQQYGTTVRYTQTYANPLPGTLDATGRTIAANTTPPSIRMRAAAL